MSNVMELEVVDGVGVIAIDNPPVNALGINVRRALVEGFDRFAADPAVKAVVLICNGRTFFAGADIAEFRKPPVEPVLTAVLGSLDS